MWPHYRFACARLETEVTERAQDIISNRREAAEKREQEAIERQVQIDKLRSELRGHAQEIGELAAPESQIAGVVNWHIELSATPTSIIL